MRRAIATAARAIWRTMILRPRRGKTISLGYHARESRGENLPQGRPDVRPDGVRRPGVGERRARPRRFDCRADTLRGRTAVTLRRIHAKRRKTSDNRSEEVAGGGVAVPVEPEPRDPRNRVHDPYVHGRVHLDPRACPRGIWPLVRRDGGDSPQPCGCCRPRVRNLLGQSDQILGGPSDGRDREKSVPRRHALPEGTALASVRPSADAAGLADTRWRPGELPVALGGGPLRARLRSDESRDHDCGQAMDRQPWRTRLLSLPREPAPNNPDPFREKWASQGLSRDADADFDILI